MYFGCAFTMIRQTVIMGLNPDDNTLWAWMTLTLPPKRASCGTITSFSCNIVLIEIAAQHPLRIPSRMISKTGEIEHAFR